MSKKTTLSGKPPRTEGSAPGPIDPETGMNEDYWILPEEERAKGFIRPLRFEYVHKTCGALTVMHRSIAETYARDPKFYGATFCSHCKEHFPVREFVWEGTEEEVGT